jgi:hypothetical protein
MYRREAMMFWVRAISGGLLILIGFLWILQGIDVLGGSGMSGQDQYAALGVIVGLVGIWLLQGAVRGRWKSPVSSKTERSDS